MRNKEESKRSDIVAFIGPLHRFEKRGQKH